MKEAKSGPAGDGARRAKRRRSLPANLLPESEWAWHKLKDSEIPDAGRWELDRHRGHNLSPYLESEWHQLHSMLRDWKKRRAAFFAGPLRVRRRIPEELKGGPNWHYGEFGLLLERTVDEIIASFRKWLVSKMGKKLRRNRPSKSKIYWRSVLVDIAIFRADEATYTRPQAISLMRPMLKAFGLWSKQPPTKPLNKATILKSWPEPQGKLSRPHWSRSLARARQLKSSH
jgi:hypothetical protein